MLLTCLIGYYSSVMIYNFAGKEIKRLEYFVILCVFS